MVKKKKDQPLRISLTAAGGLAALIVATVTSLTFYNSRQEAKAIKESRIAEYYAEAVDCLISQVHSLLVVRWKRPARQFYGRLKSPLVMVSRISYLL